uniref:ZM domain-containing protein n=1 Tax=Syphacia muris TaxID=451379 RepID=A0A0N5ALL9_9BILA
MNAFKCYKNGHSRLSLNEPFMFETLPPPFLPLPTLNPKQMKKLQKKQKKLMKKIGPMLPPMIGPPPPMPPYSRAFSVDNLNNHVLDGYAELPAINKRSWKSRREHRKSHHFDEYIPQVPPGPPRSTISSNCSNGFVVSEIRGQTSCPSTNLSDHSRITSSNTEHSSSFLRSLSSEHSRNSPLTNGKSTLSEKSSSDNLRHSADTQPTTDTIIQQNHEHTKQLSLDFVERREHELTKRINSHEVKTTTVQVEKYVPYGSDAETHEEYSSETEKLETHKSSVVTQEKPKSHRYSDVAVQAKRYFEVDNYRSSPSSSSCNGVHSQSAAVNTNINNNNSNSKNEQHRISESTELSDTMSNERTIPIKITPEAKQILERNAQLFPRNPIIESDDQRILPTADVYERHQSTASSITPNGYAAPSTGLQSLKKNGEYGSTISSLTQSSNMKTEVSDIDFSWVNDVENRLDREIAFVQEDYPKHQMPVRYFGVPTPVEQNSCIIPAAQRNTARKAALIVKPAQLSDENDTRKELSQIRSDVRSKAAMFDSGALKTTKKCNNVEQFELQKGNMRYRSRSIPRIHDETNITYISQPDYRNYNSISVDTCGVESQAYYHGYSEPLKNSPDQRRIQKPVMIDAEDKITIRPQCSTPDHQKYYEWNRPPNRISYFKPDKDLSNKPYDTKDYYRQNHVKRNHEKNWRASVAY